MARSNTEKLIDVMTREHGESGRTFKSALIWAVTEEGVSPSFLVRNWPPALKMWSTKAAKDAFFASPQFPRLTRPENLKRTIMEGVSRKPPLFGYVEKAPDGSYVNLRFGDELSEDAVEISDDVYLIPKDLAESIKAGVGRGKDRRRTGKSGR